MFKFSKFLIVLFVLPSLVGLTSECQGSNINFNVSIDRFYYFNYNYGLINQIVERHYAQIFLKCCKDCIGSNSISISKRKRRNDCKDSNFISKRKRRKDCKDSNSHSRRSSNSDADADADANADCKDCKATNGNSRRRRKSIPNSQGWVCGSAAQFLDSTDTNSSSVYNLNRRKD